MIDWQAFVNGLATEPGLAGWCDTLPEQIHRSLDVQRCGDLPRWQAALDALPDYPVSHCDLNADTVAVHSAATVATSQQAALRQTLQVLHPWRKGPFDLFGVRIDTEWRSDWKWQRLTPHISPLQNRLVLDVGCGSGYHCWRMRGAGARRVVGIDPGLLSVMQFQALQRYIGDHRVGVLPLRMEDLPPRLGCFDTVFSMGVLYHRRSPFDHLQELKDALRPGGELVLETLVVDGDATTVLVPEGRYARMRNVWCLPSVAALLVWMKKLGLRNARCVDVAVTGSDEQRSTEWMRFQSLADSLNPDDPRKTLEGYPAPTRAVLIAQT
ncbi:MAG: tRNA 5-methoxyuridine(34)/uridine 5-oxyacetic acid(34) synthase CmoB [Spongiibacteraceae bacterium]|nr:tRNA 5-methoxyuridine(34)/uridine 5-oxyacetic acid(34) synthase CmoB [Spongiibacteraceae bacterium]